MKNPLMLKVSLSCIITSLIIIGIVAGHATGGRINNTPVGLGELLLVVALILIVFKTSITKNIPRTSALVALSLFWLFSVPLLILGYFTSNIYGIETDQMAHNLLAILLVAFFCIGASLHFVSGIKTERAIRFLFILFLLIQLCVFVVAKTRYSMFGIELFSSSDHYRFKGLASNPNQLALYFCIMPFIFIHSLRHRNYRQKMLFVLIVLLTLYLGYQIRSDALMLAWLAGALAYIVFVFLAKIFKSLFWQLCFLGGAIFVILVSPVLLIDGQTFFSSMTSEAEAVYYAEGNQGSVRLKLWNNGFKALQTSPVFGFGPGNFSGLETPLDNTESHNTIIDWGLQMGLAGVLLLSILVLRPFVNLWKTMRVDLIAGIVALIVFAEFHYVLRHPLVWLIILWIWLAGLRPEDSKEIVAENKDGLEPQ